MPQKSRNDAPNVDLVDDDDEVVPTTATRLDGHEAGTERHNVNNNRGDNVRIAVTHQRLTATGHSSLGGEQPLPQLKTSIYDWDAPSSFTGTVKRRPQSGSTPTPTPTPPSSSPPRAVDEATLTTRYDSQRQIRVTRHHHQRRRSVDERTTHRQQVSKPAAAAVHVASMQRTHRNKDSGQQPPMTRQRLQKTSDRNANSTTAESSTDDEQQQPEPLLPPQPVGGGTIRKSFTRNSSAMTTTTSAGNDENAPRHTCSPRRSNRGSASADQTTLRDANYMELNFYAAREQTSHFTELYCDFPVSYESTTIVTAAQFAKHGLVTKPPPQPPPPPYREPPPPTPPPLSQMPSRDMARLLEGNSAGGASVSVSAPATPSRGKVVLSKKERKELSKLNKLQEAAVRGGGGGSAANLAAANDLNDINGGGSGGSASAQCSPYKGRVNELRNCIAKINSRGLFASLQRSSQKSLSSATAPEEATSSNEASPPPPAPDTSPPAAVSNGASNTNANNNDADYSDKLKNLPVRQRKTHISHMDNYCLFDPVDFINEKTMRNRMQEPASSAHGLRDPLFSSSQNLDFGEEEMVPEVIYDDQEPEATAAEEAAGGCLGEAQDYAHHNYFVIDPQDFQEVPMLDIGIPHPYSNDHLITTKLEETLKEQQAEMMRNSASLETLLHAFNTAPSMSNSQESKDTNTTASTTTTTSTALVESSTSTNSTSSSTSATSSQTTLQRTKKKLTFLNLSPFSRSSKSSNSAGEGGSAGGSRGGGGDAPGAASNAPDANQNTGNGDNKTAERAVSALVSSDHMLHLQHMLLDGKDQLRSRTVPIESNYVLFNPGPVPSRNLQYKIRKPRPLSTHSDADSGFLSPCSPDELSSSKFNPAILVLQQCDSVQGYIEIYTDWANYYLERAKSKKKVTDLSADCRDGLLLADVIEAVTSFKVPDMVKKPKTQQQMYDNVNSCLNVLRSQAVGGLDNITPNDICAGRLKAVLALFFALSRFKQQSKQTKCGSVVGVGGGSGGIVAGSGCATTTAIKAEIHQQPGSTSGGLGDTNSTTPNANVLVSTTGSANQQQQQQQQQQQHAQSVQNGNDTMVNRQIPTAYSKANGGTAIPLPATVMVQRRCPPDKVRPLPPTPNHTPSIPGLGKSGSDFNSSRPNSPPTSNHTIQSLKSGNNNGLRPPTVKTQTHQSGIQPPSVSAVSSVASAAPQQQQKHSMLDKLKLFNKEKQQQQNAVTAAANKTQTQSKRTSSSSGFSSARSERSDSSLSLNDGHISQIKPPTVSVTAGKGKPSTKQSKLLAAQLKKDQLKAAGSKLDKKEKSPARSLNREEGAAIYGGGDSRCSTMGRSKNSLPRVSEKNSVKNSSKTSLNSNSKSESKSSLIMPGTKTLQSPVGGSCSSTGLPKPIAAIKGTSKLPQAPPGADHKTRPMSASNSQHELLKREKSDISTATTSSNHISGEAQRKDHNNHHHHPHLQNGTHIVKPVAILPEPGSKPPYYANSNYMNPEPPHIYSASSRLPPPKTGLTTPTPRKLEYNAGPHILSPQRSPVHQAAPESTASTSAAASMASGLGPGPGSASSSPTKYHTIPSKIVGTIYEEEKPVNVLPMRPLLRGYNSHVTLPTRGTRGTHHYVADFCENDIGQGYCSDGDALRITSASSRLTNGGVVGVGAAPRYHDIDNGYLSEGSGGVGLSPNGSGSNGKHFLSMMRARTQLPTTIEERIRNSRGSLDSIGTAPPSSAASQASSGSGSNSKMDATNGGGGGSGNGSANASPQHQHHHGSPGHHHQQQQQQQQHASHRSASRNGRDNWMKMPEPMNGHRGEKSDKGSPSRRSVGGGGGGSGGGGGGSGGSSKQGSPSSSRTKGVPPSFGYVKRANGCATATAEQQNIMMMGGGGGCGGMAGQNGLSQSGGRTAHVSAVPRTAGGAAAPGSRKVSGGTQTLPNDMSKNPPNTQHRSFSLTGPGATQLSQSIRERLATGSHSLPKPGTDLHIFQHRMSNRAGKMIDGSLSDTQTYAEVKPEYSTYAMWLKHSNTAGSRLSEGDSLENMQIGSPAMTRHGHKMLQHRSAAAAAAAAAQAAAVAAGGACAQAVGTESPYVQSPRLNRSNSIRSTKSEKMYPSMLSRGPDVDIEPYYCLPVGTIAAQNGVISAQMAAAAAAAAASHMGGGGTGGGGGGGGGSAVGAGSVVWSQPTSPTPINRGFGGTLSPTHGGGGIGGMGMGGALGMSGLSGAAAAAAAGHRLTYPKKNDEVHGSAASLLSGGSSLYGSAEERQANEIRRLKRELIDAREQVMSLSSQLSTNAHVVAAFEQSLSNMTSRLQQLTATAERKDGELTDMRQTIELLRKQSIQAGLTTAHMQSMGVQTQGQTQNDMLSNKPPQLPLNMSAQHMSRAAHLQQLQQQHHQQQQQQAATNGTTSAIGGMQRHHSSDSMCSLNSISSGCSAQDKKKKKGWLRSSFTKAFSRNAKISKTSRHAGGHHGSPYHGQGGEHASGSNGGFTKTNGHGGHGGEPAGLSALATQPAPPMPTSPTKSSPAKTVTLIENAKPIDAIDQDDHQVVEDLKKQLREKDLVLTDIRLEALSSASQLESLKETVNKMRAEMLSLKQNNERLQKMVTSRSLAGSEVSLGNAISPNGSIGESRRYSLADGNTRPPMELPKRLEEEVEEENIPPAPAPEPPPPPLSPTTHIDLTPPPPALDTIPSPAHMPAAVEELPDVTDGKKIGIACYLGQPESFVKYCEEMLEVDDFYANASVASNTDAEGNERAAFPTASLNEFVVAYTYISGKTTWQNLDYIVRKTFKDYVSRIDPGTNLGLNTDSITSYHLGEAKRGPEMGFPELLPCGYIVGNVRTLYICLQGVGSLAFDSLIPRSIVHRYISLLTEHRRLILCGPSGTGKSYLARRLAEFLVARSGRGNPSEAIATFNVDHKSSKELRQYLGHIAEQAAIANGASELPSVIILDNLHHASALGDVFSCLLSAGPAAKLPCIIGTMSQATCNTTNLQLHHNFRWVLTANHMEPVKGFLGRFLRRRQFQLELQTQHPQPELATVLAWLPTVWQHINRFLEIHSSSDVTIGPRLFLACPLDLKDSQVWFTDIWNYHLSPYLVEAVREGVQLYGRRGGAWNDPSVFIRNSYPWPYGPDSVPPLRQINAEDVGLEGVAANSGENQDPLLNMLMRLQEAANYSENQDQESDCASLDSNITPDSSAGAE